MKRLSMLALLLAPLVALASLPETTTEPVTDTYHGEEVVDDYRWLENWEDPRVQEWSESQNGHAREYLDALPAVDAIRARIAGIMETPTSRYGSPAWAEGNLFVIKNQPPKQQSFLIVMDSGYKVEDARVLVDPNEIDPTGSTTIDWYRPSPDGQLVAVSMSSSGTESGDVHIFRVDTGAEVEGEMVPRVNGGTAGGDLDWLPDGSGFFYTRYPREGDRPEEDMGFYQQIYFRSLGTPGEEDRYELGKDFDRISEIKMEMNKATGHVLATVQLGDGGQFDFYLRSPDGNWGHFAGHDDRIVQAIFGPDEAIYLISRDEAPRGKVLRLPMANLDLAGARVIIPQGEDTIVNDFYYVDPMVATDSRLYVTYQLGGPSELRVFDHSGSPLDAPEQLPVASVSSPTPLEGDLLLFSQVSYIEPRGWYVYDPVNNKTIKTGLATKSPVDYSDTEVVREWATSKDGTKVPVNIIRPKGVKLDGSNPVMLTGYGGYGLSLTPGFSATRKVWLEQGGVYAVANLRGGGEFGENWHHEGRLTRKQNVFDDFAACMQYMIDAGYTNSEKMVIVGGSNGGLLMGAMIAQHPGLAKAVLSYVGIYDMLRVELSPNGAFNIPEFGTVKDPDHFKALRAYSPYHNLKKGEAYPATLFLTGANDPRVDPMQSRKMTALMQANSSGDAPVLLRTSSNTGHGGGTPLNERIEQLTDTYSFGFNELGITYKPVRAD